MGLNEKNMETGKQTGEEIIRKYKKDGIFGKMTKDVKQEEYTGKIKILNRGVNENGIDIVENKEEEDGEEDGVEVQQQSNTIMATMMADWSDFISKIELDRAADTEKETAEKEKKEEREILNRKEKEKREELYRKEKEERQELYRKEKEEREECRRLWMESAKGYDISMKDVVSDGKECDVAGEPQGNTVRRKFRKFGLKKMENMKEGNYTGEIMNLTVPVNERKNGMMTTIEEYEGEEDGAKEEEKVGNEGKNTEVAAAGENEDLDATGVISATGAMGATEDESTSTTGEDGAVNEDDGLMLEEEKTVEERKNTEAAAEDEENEDFGATGATEDEITSTAGEDGAVNEDDGLILEEEEIVEKAEATAAKAEAEVDADENSR